MASQRAGVLGVVEFFLLHPRLFIVALFVVIMGTVMATTAARLRTPENSQVKNPTAIDMMHVAFVGRHSASEIEAQMRRAAAAFDLPATDQNFSRMGSALVALRKESRVPEMELLHCARAMRDEVKETNVKLDFPSAAGMCAVTLSR